MAPSSPVLSGVVPASVILTITLQELLANTGLAETADGTQLSPEQLLNIADEADIWPTILNGDVVPLALGRTRRLASPGQTMALIARTPDAASPAAPTQQPGATDTTSSIGYSAGQPSPARAYRPAFPASSIRPEQFDFLQGTELDDTVEIPVVAEGAKR